MAIEETTTTGDGAYLTGLANVPGTPTYIGHNTGEISFTFSANENGDQVEYAIYFQEVNYAGAVTNEGYLAADGSDNGASEIWQDYATWTSTTSATGLTVVQYKFKVKARNEADVETLFSDYSAYMSPYLNIDVGPASNTVSYEANTGECKISGVSITGTSKIVTLAFTLTRINTPATLNNVTVEFSSDGITYTDITASGAITGAVASLAASVAGTAHSLTWSTCLTVGNSFHAAVYIRTTPYDTATAGNATAAGVATGSIDNRPLAITIAESRGFPWDDDLTPIIIGAMVDIQCGNYGYMIAQIKNRTGTLIGEYSSAEDVTGWEYETALNTWVVPSIYGIPAAYFPPTATGLRVRYTLQTPLTPTEIFTITLFQAEVVHTIP